MAAAEMPGDIQALNDESLLSGHFRHHEVSGDHETLPITMKRVSYHLDQLAPGPQPFPR